MNKWQIICPVVLLLAAGVWFSRRQFRNEDKALRMAIGDQLRRVLKELENHQENGRFPNIGVARADLNDAETERKLTSLFGVKDLWYNPSQPACDSDADVLCVHFGKRMFSIGANEDFREVGGDYPERSGFVTLQSKAE